MKALCKTSTDKYDMKLIDMDIPKLDSDDVLINIKAAGICGTDIKMYQGKYFNHSTPIVLGHEFSGLVTSIGENVEDIKVGQKVTAKPSIHCGSCHNCINGKPNLCFNRNRTGFEQNGGFAEFVKVKQDQVFVLPDEVDIFSGAMVEPLSVVLHALRNVKISPYNKVHIIGPGTIGLLALMLCKANGAFVSISGISADKNKLLLAEKLGADLVLEVDQQSVYDLKMKEFGELGVDIVLECSGSPEGVDSGLELCKFGGSFVQLGTWSKPIKIDFMKIAYKEIQVYGSYSHTTADWIDSITLLKNKTIDVSPLVEGIFPLEEWEQGFKKAESGQAVKVILEP